MPSFSINNYLFSGFGFTIAALVSSPPVRR
jgi:hypothetical protein